jgi:hypothetical protein
VILVRTCSEIPLPSPLFYSLSCQRAVAIWTSTLPSLVGSWLFPDSCIKSAALAVVDDSGCRSPIRSLKTSISWGVWLGRHAFYNTTKAS